MKIKLDEALKSYDAFLNNTVSEETEINTEVDTNDAVDVEVTKEPMIKDIDAIINSLETLAGQVAEAIEEVESEVIEEAGAMDTIKSFIQSRKAAKAQDKVNQIKVNQASLQIAAKDAPNKEQRETLKAKKEVLDAQIDKLQKAVDDRFSGKGEMVDRKLGSSKIKGEMEVLKALSGGDMTDGQSKNAKERMAKLQKRYKDQEAALKELEPSDEEKEAAKAKAKEAAEKSDAKKEQPKESLIIRANEVGLNELATEIESKLDWQLAEGTVLRLNYESMIRKAEADKTLNESRYFNNNVKDAFRRLL